MIRQSRLNIFTFILYLAADIVAIILSLFLPYVIRWNILGGSKVTPAFIQSSVHWGYLFFPSLEQYSRLYVFWGLITIFFLNNQNLYRTNRLIPISKEATLSCKAVLSSTLVCGLAVFFIKAIHISRLVFIGNFLFLCITLSLWRIIKKLILRRMILNGYNNFNVLIIGTNKVALELVEQIHNHPFLGWKIVGFLDDKRQIGESVAGFRVLGETEDFERIIHQYFIDEVLIAVAEDREKLVRLINLGKQINVSIKIIPDPFEFSLDVVDIYRIGHLPILGYSIKELHGADLFGKRATDIILSSLCLILFLPLIIVLSIIIKISDGGPICYVSKRYGRKGIPFKFYKFRSMVNNADVILASLKDRNEKDGPIFKLRNDPRVNRLGRILRRYSIDEIPQLWNVLKGEMSFVGPRPLPLGQVEEHDFDQLKRLEIKPGITGLWQIKGRSDVSFSKFVAWDIWYINNWSLWLDFIIILRTIPVVLKGKGAY